MLTRFARALDEAADDDKCLRLILEIASGRLDRPEAVTEAPETVVVTAEPTVEDYLEQDSFEDEAEMAAVTLVDDPELLMMTVATARALDLRDRIVAATGLSTRKVSRNLNAARGQTLLKNLFNFGRPAASATNPAMANEVDARRLSSNVQYPFHELFRLTVAQAGADDVRVQLVRVLDLGPQLVTRRLSESHGRTLLANIFVEQQTKEWIRKKTVRWAIDVQAEQHVHQLTQVSLKEVRARFARGAPQRTLERVFPEARWDG
jgi:hypothetical protein